MIDSLQVSTLVSDAAPRREKSVRDESAQGFSYALAAASLERNAAKSLEAHGARPQGSAATQSQSAAAGKEASSDGATAPTRDQSAPAAKSAVADRNAPPTATTNATTLARSEPAASPVATAIAPVANAQTAAAAKPATISAAREAAADKVKPDAAKAPRIPAAPAALKAEFAEILAKRLEKTSVFELRLDPPELGRVEGRLAVDDDGKAVLSLTFDNREAFNQFSRDEEALRFALQQAGLQFDTGDFAFAFRERSTEGAISAAVDGPTALPASAAAYDPQFFADWSAGALDIRI